jgi:hypothetical protein
MSSKPSDPLHDFLENFTRSSISRGSKLRRALVPSGEEKPTMWKIQGKGTKAPVGLPPGLPTLDPGANPWTYYSDQLTDEVSQKKYMRLALFGVIALIGCSTPDLPDNVAVTATEVHKWATLITTLARLVFEDPLSKPGFGADEKSVSDPMLATLRGARDLALCVVSGYECDNHLQISRTHILTICSELGLPAPGTYTDLQYEKAFTADGAFEIAAYYSMVVLMSGKSLTTQAHDAIATRRPGNLQQKFHEGQEWGTIGGVAKMSKGTYTRIAKIWQMNTTLRLGLLIPLIGLEEGDAYTTGNIVFTMFKLLKNSGFAHVQLILQFCRQYPFVAKMPEFTGEMQYLAAHSRALARVDPALQPYYKLLYSDSAGLFDSKVLTSLTSLACDVLSRTNSTVKDYFHQSDPSILRRFDIYEGRYVEDIAEPVYESEGIAEE